MYLGIVWVTRGWSGAVRSRARKHEAPAWSASRLWLVACCAIGGVLP